MQVSKYFISSSNYLNDTETNDAAAHKTAKKSITIINTAGFTVL